MKIRDSFTNQLIAFNNQKLNIYLCGPTVYDNVHIGNLRPVIIFDILNRILKLDHKLDYAHNITDIDDKIINRAIEKKATELKISEYYLKKYLDILNVLEIDQPDYLPKVSDNIDIILKFIKELIRKEKAYSLDGDVYFSIKKWDKYEEINNFLIDELRIGDLSNKNKKKDPFDFALWKDTKDKGIKFNSPWGYGRPGWHTECVSIIDDYFKGETLDIHGGGIDLKFPHHVNERAQFESLKAKPLANVWMHIGYVNFNDKKMSKSLKNVFSAEEFLKKYSANILKFLLISTHYTKPINVNENSISNAQFQILKIKNLLVKLLYLDLILAKDFKELIDQDFLEILNNNLDLPNGISYLNNQIKLLNKNFEISIFQKFLFNLKILGIKYIINFKKIEQANKKNKDIEVIKEIVKV